MNNSILAWNWKQEIVSTEDKHHSIIYFQWMCILLHIAGKVNMINETMHNIQIYIVNLIYACK